MAVEETQSGATTNDWLDAFSGLGQAYIVANAEKKREQVNQTPVHYANPQTIPQPAKGTGAAGETIVNNPAQTNYKQIAIYGGVGLVLLIGGVVAFKALK